MLLHDSNSKYDWLFFYTAVDDWYRICTLNGRDMLRLIEEENLRDPENKGEIYILN